MTKTDPFGSQVSFDRWYSRAKSDGIEGVNNPNTKLLLSHIAHMKAGLNVAVSSRKGARSPARLMTIANRLMAFMRLVQQQYGEQKHVDTLTSTELLLLFSAVRDGELKGRSGKALTDVATLAKVTVAFWHWWMRYQRSQGVKIEDITLDLHKGNDKKPNWVYLEHFRLEKLRNAAPPFYSTLLWFNYDAGLRPGELLQLRCGDIVQDEDGTFSVIVRPETSKVKAGRTIQLLLSGEQVRDHIIREKLGKDDLLFGKNEPAINMYLKRLALDLFGSDVTLARERYNQLTIEDLRHNSICMRIRMKEFTVADLMAIYGWKKPDKIHYYSELLGLHTKKISPNTVAEVLKGRSIEKQLEESEQRQAATNQKLRLLEQRFEDFMTRVELLIEAGVFPAPGLNKKDQCSGRDYTVFVKEQGRDSDTPESLSQNKLSSEDKNKSKGGEQ